LVPIIALVLALPRSSDAQATAPAPAPQAPLPNRLNEVFPNWLRVRAEFRERVEGFESAGFVPDRDDSYYLSRFRLNATVTPSKLLSFQAQVQDSRVADKSIGPTTAPFRGPFDLRLGFAQVGNAKSPVTVQAGASSSSSTTSGWWAICRGPTRRARGTAGTSRIPTRRFSSTRLAHRSSAVLPGEFDKSGAGNRFAGAYLQTTKVIPGVSLMPFAFWKA
jgi:hypothetical protein